MTNVHRAIMVIKPKDYLPASDIQATNQSSQFQNRARSNMTTAVKICGISSLEIYRHCAQLGVDWDCLVLRGVAWHCLTKTGIAWNCLTTNLQESETKEPGECQRNPRPRNPGNRRTTFQSPRNQSSGSHRKIFWLKMNLEAYEGKSILNLQYYT